MGAFDQLDGMPSLHAIMGDRRDEIFKLLQKPLSVIELCRATDLTKPAIGYHLQILTAAPRKIHICDWIRSRSGPFAAVYLAGDLPDAPKPLLVPRHIARNAKRQSRSDAIDAQILALIVSRPMSRGQLTDVSGLGKGVVGCSVERLHARPKRIYIEDHQATGQGQGKRPVPRYRAGNKPDAEYAPPAPRDPDRDDKTRKAAQLVAAATSRQNTWLGALM